MPTHQNTNRLRVHRRFIIPSLCVAVVCFLSPVSRAQQIAESGASIEDWLRIAPGDARFYAELHDLAATRDTLRKLGMWETVRELSHEAPRGATTRPWHQTAEQFLGMDPEKAIDDLLGRRCAVIATEPAEWQNGVMLAELARADDLNPLLKKWRAKPLSDEGPVKRHELAGGLLLAALDRTIAIGPPGDPEGLWGRTVLLMSGRRGPALGGRSECAALRARITGHPNGLLYVSWNEGDPFSFAGCLRLLVGINIKGSEIQAELHGQRPAPPAPEQPCDAALLERLPASTALAFSDSYDFVGLAARVRKDEFLQGESVLGLLVTAFSSVGDRAGALLEQLGPAYSLVVSADRKTDSAPAQPSIALVIPSRAGQTAVDQLDSVLGLFAQVTATLAADPGPVPEIAVAKKSYQGVELHFVTVGPAMAKRLRLPFLEPVELCWFLAGDRLVLCTSIRQAQELAVAIKSLGPASKPAPSESDNPPASRTASQQFTLRGVLFSEMLRSWQTQLTQANPELLSQKWWQSWAAQSLDRYTRLGVVLEPDRTSRVRCIVREVDPLSAAQGYLEPGDIILAVSGRALTTTRPAQEVAQRFRERGASRRFQLLISRAGQQRELSIPVQPVDPLDLSRFDPDRAIRQLIALTMGVDTVTIRRVLSSPDRLDAQVQIRWAAAR